MDFNTALAPSGERPAQVKRLIDGWSIEVLPRTAAKIADFRQLLPAGTNIFLAHVDGTPLEDMVSTARRLCREGFVVTPHIPARSIENRQSLKDLLQRYRDEADMRRALLLAGGASSPRGEFSDSFDLIETGFFDRAGFEQLHVAGHPEGNRDIQADGGHDLIDNSLLRKQALGERSGCRIVISTQFAFDSNAILAWSKRIADLGVDLPVHVGLAGPAKLQTLIKYAITCGVGPSLKVLQRRAMDVRRLLLPYEPTELALELERYKQGHPESLIEQFHLFPLGGIEAAVTWAKRQQAS
ncbi:methylenetetrahydrofolate reductase [Rhizobium helianthi]|uniref:Methylenetetrahydrofolate reductase n=1 Tax=Rhizobium helianthi TaxID=1132695 RepID=A0ABW4M370_9HYPH